MEHYEEFRTSIEKLQMDKSVSLAIAPNVAAIHLSKLFPYMQEQLPGCDDQHAGKFYRKYDTASEK